MIQEVINNITGAENEAEDIVRIASQQAKDIKLQAEYQCEIIRKRTSEQCKEAVKLRSANAEIAAHKKTDRILKDGEKDISEFIAKCAKNKENAVADVMQRLTEKYGNY